MQQVGRYRITGELGRGAMGIVYRALDPAIGRTVAIKSIRLSDLSDTAERERLRERLFREAQSAGILSHPGIVTIYDIAEEDGLTYIFMEFVNGPPLEKLLVSEQPPDRETILAIFRQTAAALDYAHKKGIIHRDIKPANIMIHDDGAAKITDFGVAKIASQQMTQSGMMMGTPNYMSPEQIQGAAVDGKADQFSLAVIAYEILTGDKPFAGESLPTLLFKIVREDPAPPQRLNPTLGPRIEEVLGKALAKDSKVRYETCSDFVAALTAACEATPAWAPQPRGMSENMPTVAATTVGAPATLVAPPEAPPPAAVPEVEAPAFLIEPRRRGTPEGRPLLRSMLMVILGIALVALVILGVRFWLSRDDARKSAAVADPPPPSPQVEKPSPAPLEKPLEPVKAEAEKEPEPAKPEPTVLTKPELPKRPPPASDGAIKLVSNPPGAAVQVDDNPGLACVTPCSLTLPAGRHTLSARMEGYGVSRKILMTPNDTDVFITLVRVVGTLNISSIPPGAAIWVDGQEQARSTPAILTLPAGKHRLELVKDTLRHAEDIEIKDGAITERSFSLR